MRRILFGIAGLVYLSVIVYFAFRPFEPIPGFGYEEAPLQYDDGAVHICIGTALEDRRNVTGMRKALMKSGQISLVVTLRTDSLSPRQSGRIIAYVRDCPTLNFALDQEGSGVSFSLLTTGSGNSGVLSDLVVPSVLDANRWQQLAATYDGSRIRLFVDGKLRGERSGLSGGFSKWGRDHTLVFGDDPAGGYPWSGLIRQIAIYDRALDDKDVVQLNKEKAFSDAVLAHDFQGSNASAFSGKDGIERLRYRNLFIGRDVLAVQLRDCIANIVGFIPLGFFAYMLLPPWIERRRILAVIMVPAMVGFLAAGSIEWLQRYILWRVPNALDIVYNLTGTLLGSLFAWLANSHYEKCARKG